MNGDSEMRVARADMRKKRQCFLAPVAVAITLAFGVVAACGTPNDDAPADVSAISNQRDGLTGTVIAPQLRLPDITLTATDGTSFNLRADTRHPLTLVFFGYTHCPDECPLTTANVAVALGDLPSEVRDQVQVLFVTADPTRDTPQRNREYLDRFDPTFEGLTGPREVIRTLVSELGVYWEKPTPTPTNYDVQHSLQVYAFNGITDDSLLLWNGTPNPHTITHDLEQLAEDL